MPRILRPDEIDAVIHERVRLGILSALFGVRGLSFIELRDKLGVSDGNLSVHSRVLEKKDYIHIDKDFVDRKPRTTLSLTPEGRKKFWKYVGLLEEFVKSF